MKTLKLDPLLTIASGILIFLIAISGISACLLLAGTLAPFIFGEAFQRHLVEEGANLDFSTIRWQIAMILLLAASLTAILMRICWLLRKIVQSVGAGDPFIPENARRLTQMAWLSLAFQLIGVPIMAIATWLRDVAVNAGMELERVHVEQGLDLNGLLLMLILFILARVFRKGADMRADLEGMV